MKSLAWFTVEPLKGVELSISAGVQTSSSGHHEYGVDGIVEYISRGPQYHPIIALFAW